MHGLRAVGLAIGLVAALNSQRLPAQEPPPKEKTPAATAAVPADDACVKPETAKKAAEGNKPARPKVALTPAQLDELIASELAGAPVTQAIGDEQFVRRATLDLLGRQPTTDETSAFLAEDAADKRALLVDRLLANEQFGRNWANYWSDTISYRVPQPELTFLSYATFKGWLAGNINANQPWDQTVREILTATGTVKDNPAATFVGFHEGNATRLASETARVFLSLNLQCAQCHDHPFENWKQDEYHRLAAFFARTEAKLPWNDSDKIVVKDRGKGEHRMPADAGKQGKVMTPGFMTGETLELDKNDLERRQFLAALIASPDNKWFARAFVNRIWARLFGRGFSEPIDNVGEFQTVVLPKVHDALAFYFANNGFDVKDLFRLTMRTEAYQRQLGNSKPDEESQMPFAAAKPAKLRGDEVFDSLVTAIGLPNVRGEQEKATDAVRFPPPPKSTRDLVAETFGFDPSLAPQDVPRTMPQVMLMMNNAQLQTQIDAKAASGTQLSKWLAADSSDESVVRTMYRAVLARQPADKELAIAVEHVKAVGERGPAFEDLLWGLLNSAEFTTRK